MGGLPNLVFIVDPSKEHVAVEEARKLGIPIAAIVDTNCDPSKISYPIPGSDDSSLSVQYYCKLVSDAVLAGIEYDLGRRQRVSRMKSDSTENTKDSRGSDSQARPNRRSIRSESDRNS